MRKRGFTLIELLVVIAIIAILAAILFPVFSSAKKSAQNTKCINNLKELGTAYTLYLDTWDGKFGMVGWGWWDEIQPYTKYKRFSGAMSQARTLFECSAADATQHRDPNYYYDYGMNFNLRADWPIYVVPYSLIVKPSRTIMIADRRNPKSVIPENNDWSVGCVRSTSQWNHKMDERHNNRANCVYVDGHASNITNMQSIKPESMWDVCPNDPRPN